MDNHVDPSTYLFITLGKLCPHMKHTKQEHVNIYLDVSVFRNIYLIFILNEELLYS